MITSQKLSMLQTHGVSSQQVHEYLYCVIYWLHTRATKQPYNTSNINTNSDNKNNCHYHHNNDNTVMLLFLHKTTSSGNYNYFETPSKLKTMYLKCWNFCSVVAIFTA